MTLNWTGNPYIDIGLATILAYREIDEPGLLTSDDLTAIAQWIAYNYVRDPLKSFLTVAFTSNAWFAQPSFTPEKRAERGQLHVFGWRNPSLVTDMTEQCVFTGLPVASTALSDKLSAGRAARAQIPLTQGDEDINFYPNGNAGLPISGEALLCLQAFPLGCAKVQGRLLAVHASDPAITLAFARRFLRDNQVGVQIAQAAGSTKLRETPFTLGTALISTLLEVLGIGNDTQDELALPLSLTAYHLTNGQKPEIDIHHLPLGVTRFLQRANGARYGSAWNAVVQAAWQRDDPKPSKGKAKKAEITEAATTKADKPRRNYLYEDVLALPDNAAYFLRTYLLRKVIRSVRVSDQDPRQGYSSKADLKLISWDLTTLFLLEVMNMDKIRIEHIRQLGDRLAAYVQAENDRRFFRAFYGEMSYDIFRNRLIKADTDWVRHGQPPLITFEQFVEVFVENDDFARKDWKLARDLVLIRMIEQLHGNGWLAQHQDALPEEAPAEETADTLIETAAECLLF